MKDESSTKTQRILENFANSETSALQRLKKMIDGKFYTTKRFDYKAQTWFRKRDASRENYENDAEAFKVLDKMISPRPAALLSLMLTSLWTLQLV
jgi:hypothetical protein